MTGMAFFSFPWPFYINFGFIWWYTAEGLSSSFTAMRIASRNVRCINNHRRQMEVANLIKQQQRDVIGLLDTKLEELEEFHTIMETLFARWYGAQF